MMKNRSNLHKSLLLFAGFALLATSVSLMADEKAVKKKKLKIVFLMGQSNMVGYSHPKTAWYLTQPMYLPPPKTATRATPTSEKGGFYWRGVSFAYGDSEEYNARGKELLAERRASRSFWRRRVYGNLSRGAKENNWKPEWGPAP